MTLASAVGGVFGPRDASMRRVHDQQEKIRTAAKGMLKKARTDRSLTVAARKPVPSHARQQVAC
jgi:hypothetical protein